MIVNIHNEQTRKKAIAEIAFLDISKVHQVKITCKRGKRSIDQNSLYWMWLTCIEQETGNSKEDMHEYFKQRYLGTESRLCFGEVFNQTVTTTELDTAQFKQYLDKIQIFASTELGFELPNPDDLKFEHFKDYYSKFI